MGARGYTLVELLVVLAVIALLGVMSMPVAEIAQQRARERELKLALQEIRDAIDKYHSARVTGAVVAEMNESMYPPTLDALTHAYPDARAEHRGETLRFLRRVPRDPFAGAEVEPARSWGLRSFSSEHDRPLPGNDVYDVRSLSRRRALDGSLLREW